MKNFKRFTLAISLFLLSCTAGWACAWDGDDPAYYNLFHCTRPLPELEDLHIDASALFWARYLNLPVDDNFKSDIRYLRLDDFDNEESDNLLLSNLRRQGSNDAIALLRYNTELADLVDSRFSWSYRKVTPEDYQALLAKVNDLDVNEKLSKRKAFLKMRILSRLDAYDDMMQLWNNEAKDWEPCEMRDRMEGYVARIYFHFGNYDKALPIYFRLNDGGSIRLCVNRMLDSASIKEVYQKDPNSMILGYILEDYANYFYHANEHKDWELDEEGYDVWTKVTRQRESVVALAQQIVDEGKAKDLQMWQAFIGFMQMITDQNDLAYASFVKAEELRGGSSVHKLLRHYKFNAALAMSEKPDNFDNYVAQEISHYKVYAQLLSDPEGDVLNRLYAQDTRYRFYNYVNQRGNPTLSFLAHCTLDPVAYWEMDRPLSTQQVKEVQSYVRHGGEGALGQCLVKYCDISDDQFNEMIGTKLMRDGNYTEAREYLAKVPNNYLRTLGIAVYLMNRTIPDRPFERKDRKEYYDIEVTDIRNVKLEFCDQIIQLREQLSKAKGDAKADIAYRMANMLYQASTSGDLWALSEYSWSSYGTHRNEMNVQSIDLLKLALDCTSDYNRQVECYYGLAANPCTDQDVTATYDWDNMRYYLEPQDIQREAYIWLRYTSKRDHPIFESCDWLKMYIHFSTD